MQINTSNMTALQTYDRNLPKLGQINMPPAVPGPSSVVNISREAREVQTQGGYTPSSAARELEDFMNMSESERLQWIWLNSHGVTAEEFASMSEKDKQKLLSQMREELKMSMQEKPKNEAL